MKRAEAAGKGALKAKLHDDLAALIPEDETIGVTWPITVIAGRL